MKQVMVPGICLDVQAVNSVDCGPTCDLMALRAFGIHTTLDEIKAQLNIVNGGTSLFDNGSFFLAQPSLGARMVSANCLLFPGDDRAGLQGKDRDTIMRYVISRLNSPDIINNNPPMGYWSTAHIIRFLNNGGDLLPAVPSFEHIINAIDAGSPVIANIYGQVLGKNNGHHHDILLGGYRKATREVFVYNPLRDAKQGWMCVDAVLHAVVVNELWGSSSGCLLIPYVRERH